MWWFYREKKYLIISLLIVILDGLFVYFVPCYMNKLNYFYPMLTISLIPFLSSKKSYGKIFVLGIIYDLLYSNILLYNILIFFILAIIDNYLTKYFRDSFILFIFLAFFNILVYDSFTFFLVLITSYQTVTINDLIYKVKHSLLLNIMSVFVYFFLFKKRRYKT